MKHNFDEVIDRRTSDCKKYEAASYSEDTLPMWIADTDFAVPKEITDVIVERAKHPCFGYPYPNFAFEESVQRWMKVRFGWDVDPHHVKYGPGVMPFMVYAVRAFTMPGDAIVIQPPVYFPFAAVVRNNGRQLVENRLVMDADGKYRIDFDDLDRKLADPRAKVLFLCNPHNPVMLSYSREDLTRIGELCLKHGVIVVSDEIHCDIVFGGHRHIPFASIRREFADISMVLVNPSKTFNIAGFRTGAAIIPNRRIRDDIEIAIVDNKAYGRTIFGMLTVIAAYTKCDYYADQLMEYLQGNRDYCLKFLKERIPRIRLAAPESTYLFWLNCRDLGLSRPQLKAFFAEKAKLALNDGETFGGDAAGFMRMNVATTRAALTEALTRLESAVNAL